MCAGMKFARRSMSFSIPIKNESYTIKKTQTLFTIIGKKGGTENLSQNTKHWKGFLVNYWWCTAKFIHYNSEKTITSEINLHEIDKMKEIILLLRLTMINGKGDDNTRSQISLIMLQKLWGFDYEVLQYLTFLLPTISFSRIIVISCEESSKLVSENLFLITSKTFEWIFDGVQQGSSTIISQRSNF